jgi:hypothetical protein
MREEPRRRFSRSESSLPPPFRVLPPHRTPPFDAGMAARQPCLNKGGVPLDLTATPSLRHHLQLSPLPLVLSTSEPATIRCGSALQLPPSSARPTKRSQPASPSSSILFVSKIRRAATCRRRHPPIAELTLLTLVAAPSFDVLGVSLFSSFLSNRVLRPLRWTSPKQPP